MQISKLCNKKFLNLTRDEVKQHFSMSIPENMEVLPTQY